MKKTLLILALFFTVCFSIGLARNTSAFSLFPNCSDPNAVQSSLCSVNRGDANNNTHKNVVLRDIKEATYIVAYLGGALAVIMIIVSGFSFVTSGGNSEKTQNARRRIVNALIGLAIIALAWAIVGFILNHI